LTGQKQCTDWLSRTNLLVKTETMESSYYLINTC